METSIVNLEPLRKLLRDNKGAIRKALELFVETTVEDMKALGQCIDDKKMLEASRIAHSLKSRFVYLGNDEASQKVRMLEGLLKDTKVASCTQIKMLFDEMNHMMAFCLSELEMEIKVLNE